MIEQASLIIGDGNWAVKSDSLLGYALPQGKYTPREMSVVRATTGTRVNAVGLVENVPYNIFEYSEQFDNGYWNKLGSTIGVNSIVAPNGTTTADKVVETSTTADHYVTKATNFTQGLTYTISVYAKAGERNWLALGFNNEAQRIAWFNLSTGIVGTVLSSVTATSIESVGNGWYRCSATMTAATNLPYPSIMIAPSDGVKNYLGNGTNGLFIWGAQLVEGTEPLEYLPTTDRLDIARIDYSTGSPALLVEPQRTNLLQRSEEFDNAYWTKTAATISANATTSADGNNNADKLIENSATASHLIERTQTGITSGTTYSLSIFAKKSERNFAVLGVFTGESKQIFVNLTTGAVTSTAGTWVSTLVQELSNGWFRITGVFTAASTTIYPFFAISNNGTSLSYLGDGTSGIFIYGAQLEAGAYPTSYIPTTSASVTRNADVISKTGISSLIGQTEGTIFFEGNVLNYSQARRFIVLYQDANNYITLRITGGNDLQFLILSGGATSANITTANIQGNIKIALAYKNNDFVAYLNGTQVGLDTSGNVPTTSDFYLGCDQSAINQMAGGIKAAALWKTRLSNAELTALTTI
jgi:hypothetical protein